ncbi:hypothetical protein [Rhodovulum euryhalinum]|uniref:Response regulatory domain-containing protein n=1 Tax=Rhodovulum euryhalinum TaxID=35805 RepID=A0A4R2KHT5_9RHOB|nr:hypothetical protein [Rhodovulum euryhalinum]TCO69558.1 hypothetical protein EV655_1149 [Rhodovulum euryhalinum]
MTDHHSPDTDPGVMPTFLVLEQDALISSDLIQALEIRGPCRVLHFSSTQDAESALRGLCRVEAAFLEMRFDDALNSALARALASLGARLVLTLGEDAERVACHGWHLLPRPFTERMVHDTLAEG